MDRQAERDEESDDEPIDVKIEIKTEQNSDTSEELHNVDQQREVQDLPDYQPQPSHHLEKNISLSVPRDVVTVPEEFNQS